jgi:hypothetical protein
VLLPYRQRTAGFGIRIHEIIMHKAIGLFLTVAAALSANTSALANASAKVALTPHGQVPVVLQTTTSTYGVDTGLVDIVVPPGESRDWYWDYTVMLADDGLPALRTYQFCTGETLPNCGPQPTGHELAYAQIVVGRVEPRGANPYVSISEEVVTFQTRSGATADTLTESGTLHVHATNSSLIGPSDARFLVYVLEFVDVSPVPEPSSYALLLGGLGAICAAQWRRRRA